MSALNNKSRVWELEEDKQLREMAEAGKSVTTMALRLKRTEMAIRGRLILSKSYYRKFGAVQVS